MKQRKLHGDTGAPNVRVNTRALGVRMNKIVVCFESVGFSVVCTTAQDKGAWLLANPGRHSSNFP